MFAGDAGIRKDQVMTLVAQLRAAARKRADYRRTLHELRGIPAHLSEDLGIFPGDAEVLARRAIYG